MLTLDTILKDTIWIVKMVGYRDKGTYEEVGWMQRLDECRDFDICSEQPEHLKEFYDEFNKYSDEHGFITVQDFYNQFYVKEHESENTVSESVPTDGTEVLDSYNFILGGKSEFTIKNLKSGNEYKYRVTRCKGNESIYFVKVKIEGSWIYGGFIKINEFNGEPTYIQGKNGRINKEHPSIEGILYGIRKGHSPLPRPMILLHHGKCACCGKRLDDDDSVRRGFGPVCFSRLSKESQDMVMRKVQMGA